MKTKKIIFIVALLLFPLSISAKEDLAITMIDVGLKGDGVLLESNGEYLLMDTFNPSNNNEIVNYLASKNVFNLSIYISHYHEDHYGGVSAILNDDRFTINRIYLPKTEHICRYYGGSSEASSYFPYHYNLINNMFNLIQNKNIPYTFLWPTNTSYDTNQHCFNLTENNYENKITLGKATIEIIGPVGNYNVEDFNEDTIALKGNRYMNNNSLVSMVSIGNIKYLTAGDITKTAEETALLNTKGELLKADIFKLSHHGTATSNSLEFVKKVSPKYVFAMRNWEAIDDFSHLLTSEENCTSNCYQGTNYYTNALNGSTTFLIKDDIIEIVPEKNFKTITFNYYDNDSKELLFTRNYRYIANKTYFIDSSYKNVPGYSIKGYDNNIASSGLMESDISYKIYVKKNSTSTNIETDNEKPVPKKEDEVVPIPNTLQESSKILIIIGGLLLLCGFIIFKVNVKKKVKID